MDLRKEIIKYLIDCTGYNEKQKFVLKYMVDCSYENKLRKNALINNFDYLIKMVMSKKFLG